MRCKEVDELAGAYALYALPRKELAEVERHVSGCAKHPAMGELVTAAQALAGLPPEMEPPAALKSRLMAAVRAETAREAARTARPRPDPIAWLRGIVASPRLGYGLAVAMAAVVAVVIATSGGGGGEDTLVRSFESDGIVGKVIYIPNEETAVMEVEGLGPAPEGKTYQVWAITDGKPLSIGFLSASVDGETSTAIPVQLEDGQTVAVTLEPAGGSEQPTTDPIFDVEI